MTPSPVTTGNPTLDKLRAGQFEDPQVQQAIALARQTGTLPPPDQAPNADVAQQPRPIAGPSTPQPGLVDPAAGRIQPTAASPIASLAGPAPLSAHQQEYNRITKPPIEAGALKHTQADTGRSGIGKTARMNANLEALGLRHHQDEVVKTDSPSLRGQIMRVRHLVKVTPVTEK